MRVHKISDGTIVIMDIIDGTMCVHTFHDHSKKQAVAEYKGMSVAQRKGLVE